LSVVQQEPTAPTRARFFFLDRFFFICSATPSPSPSLPNAPTRASQFFFRFFFFFTSHHLSRQSSLVCREKETIQC
jgi:hypothetical protein